MKTIEATVFLAGEPATKSHDVVFKCGAKVWRADVEELQLFIAPHNCTIMVTSLCVVFKDLRRGCAFIPMNNPGPRRLRAGETLTVAGPLELRVKK